MEIKEWNSYLFDLVKSEAVPDAPYFLYVDRSVLARVSGIPDKDQAYEEFLSAIRRGGAKNVFANAKLRHETWSVGSKRTEPPFLVELALTVLAVTESVVIREASVYRTLNKMLGLGKIGTASTPGYEQHVPSLWLAFNAFVEQQLGAKPTGQALGRYSYQGYARSQGLISLTVRRQILVPFINRYRGDWIFECVISEFRYFLRERSRLSAASPVRALADDNEDAKLLFAVLETIRFALDRQSRTSTSVRMRLDAKVKVDDEWQSVEEAFSVLVQNSPELTEHLEDVGLGQSDKFFSHPNGSLEYYLDPDEFELLRAGGEVAVTDEFALLIRPRSARAFVRSAAIGGLIEVQSSTDGVPTHYLVDTDFARDANSPLHEEVKNLPAIEDLVWLAPTAELRGLESAVEVKKRGPRALFKNGMRAHAAGNAYLNYRYPLLLASSTAVEMVRVDEELYDVPISGLDLGQEFAGREEISGDLLGSRFSLRSVPFRDRPTHALQGVADSLNPVGGLSSRIVEGVNRPSLSLCDGIDVKPGDIFVIVDSRNAGHFAKFTPEIFEARKLGVDLTTVRFSYFLDQVPDGRLLIRKTRNERYEVWPLSGTEKVDGGRIGGQADAWLTQKQTNILCARLHGDQKRVREGINELRRTLSQSARHIPEVLSEAPHRVEFPILANSSTPQFGDNPYDELLAFISHRANASAEAVEAVWEQITLGKDVRHPRSMDAVRLLAAMGHVSVRGKRVVVASPTLMPLQRFSAFTLTGFRTPGFLKLLDPNTRSSEAIEDMVVSIRTQIIGNQDEERFWCGPSTIYVSMDTESLDEISRGFQELGILVVNELPIERLNRFLSWQEYLDQRGQKPQGMAVGPSKFLIRRIGKARNPELEYSDTLGDSHVRIEVMQQAGMPAKYYAKVSGGYVRIPKEIGFWGAFQGDKLTLRREPTRIVIRNPNYLPVHYLGVLMSTTGLPPRRKHVGARTQEQLRGEWDSIERVPHRFADQFVRKVGLRDGNDQ